MQYEIAINGRTRQVTVNRAGNGFTVAVDGRPFHVDAARVDAYTLSLVIGAVRLGADATDKTAGSDLSRTRAYEVTVAADVASSQFAVRVGATSLFAALNGRRRHALQEDGPHTGPQRVVAPMPGKVVRVLVHNGQTVVTRQPIVVVEAMKMENELRAGRDGTVAEIHAQEGQSVDAGALLVIIQ